jgi:glycosyltransferase involved in cell wall biosynthesis
MAIRVLLVTSEFPPDLGGIASHVAELARALAPLADVEVVHPRSLWTTAAQWNGAGVPVHRPALIKGEPFYQAMLRQWLARKLAQQPVDILHVHGMRPLSATRGLKAKTIFTNHSSGFLARLHASPARKAATARLLTHVDALIAPSDELVEAARIFGYRGPASMIANGVDAERFHPGSSSFRAQHGIAPDEIVILLARRLAEKNGVKDFAKAVRFLEPKNFRVVIAGDGPERAKMTSILSESNQLGRVLFLGPVSNADMPDIYRAADISVLPSLAEATSIAGLEAMASGVPLVGTRVGGIPTIIADNETGLLVSPRHLEGMAAALNRLIVDRDMRARFGAAARKRVEAEFSWPTIAQATLSVYEQCLDSSLSPKKFGGEESMLSGHVPEPS